MKLADDKQMAQGMLDLFNKIASQVSPTSV